ncbi:MAG: acetylxylan esterase [Bacteroidales bacterium]|nr:acetylxylan esterase [Bacteroidales bacterium]
MKKHLIYVLAALAALAFTVPGCKTSDPDDQEQQIDPKDLKALKMEVKAEGDRIYDGKPTFTVHITNPNKVKVTASFKALFTKDKNSELIPSLTEEKEIEVPASGLDLEVIPKSDFEPGFYKASVLVDRVHTTFSFGISPFEIVSAPDYQADFNEFWEATKDQLKAIDMNAQLTEITAKSSAARKIYLVEMNSIPDGLTGEPVVVRGYYAEPQDGKKHPVIMHYFGYDDQNPTSKAYCPAGGSSSDYAEFWLSTRGQVVNNRTADKREPDGKGDFVNTYGDWFAFNFGQRDAYYYRGAFMDCIQGVRFMATRETSDMGNLFAEGSSQGGAFSYAAASLSDYPFTAISPCVAFLGDFPDYFQIVGWPANTAKENQGSMTDAEMYAFLSYFDTKNLATRIPASTAVLACSGLQDGTCPPHTNIAPFNNLATTDKEYYFYPEMGHSIPSDWTTKMWTFFKDRIK